MQSTSVYQLQPIRAARWSPFASIITGIILFYVGGFLLFQLALITPLGDWWLLRFLNIFGYAIYAPWLILLSLLLFKQQRRLRLLAMSIPLLFFVGEYGALFVPQLPPRIEGTPVRVMSWNLYFYNQETEQVVAAIEKEQPDLLLVQEFGTRIATDLSQRLRKHFPHQSLYPHHNPIGYAVFSRYPIRKETPPQLGYDSCACQQVIVEIEGRPVTLVNVHPHIPEVDFRVSRRLPLPISLDTTLQDSQFTTLLEEIPTLPSPALLVGDFNASDRMWVIPRIQRLMTDTHREAGWGFGFTFPVDADFFDIPLVPLVRLDYIFHDEAWRTQRVWTGEHRSSDHRYLVADLLLVK